MEKTDLERTGIHKLIVLIAMALIGSCSQKSDTLQKFTAADSAFVYQGRIHKVNDSSVAFIGPASGMTTLVDGASCSIHLRSKAEYNYITLVVDEEHLGRFKVEAGGTVLPITFKKLNKSHKLELYKATEASSKALLFEGITAKAVSSFSSTNELKIEFIGNSISCGAAMDNSILPCEEGAYLDHGNAYLGYAPRLARALNANYIVNAVSGYGAYRGWNTEEEEKHTLPAVYENTYLDDTANLPWDALAFQPDIISICLGTNDLSAGDGIKERLPFNKQTFLNRYIAFIESLYRLHPRTKIVLLNSPMVEGEKNKILVGCLKEIQTHFNSVASRPPIQIFQYKQTYTNGCITHPSVEDHEAMAEELLPFFKKVMALK